jgi:hypothetical protein
VLHSTGERFQMGPQDPATGAYNLGGRLFNPEINRFVGADNYVAAASNMELASDPLTATVISTRAPTRRA